MCVLSKYDMKTDETYLIFKEDGNKCQFIYKNKIFMENRLGKGYMLFISPFSNVDNVTEVTNIDVKTTITKSRSNEIQHDVVTEHHVLIPFGTKCRSSTIKGEIYFTDHYEVKIGTYDFIYQEICKESSSYERYMFISMFSDLKAEYMKYISYNVVMMKITSFPVEGCICLETLNNKDNIIIPTMHEWKTNMVYSYNQTILCEGNVFDTTNMIDVICKEFELNCIALMCDKNEEYITDHIRKARNDRSYHLNLPFNVKKIFTDIMPMFYCGKDAECNNAFLYYISLENVNYTVCKLHIYQTNNNVNLCIRK